MHLDWRWLVPVLVIVLILYWEYRKQRVSREPSRIWQCCRYQGGANVYTPHPMTETEALEFASALGSVLWVDRDHGFIFYRPLGH